MKILTILGTILLLVSACSSFLKKEAAVEWDPAPVTELIGDEVHSRHLDKPSLELYVKSFGESHADTPTQWWTQYTLGLLQKEKSPSSACLAFTELSKTPRFPLKSLAQIRAIETCPLSAISTAPKVSAPNTDETPSLTEVALIKPDHLPAWLSPTWVDVGLQRAREIRDPKLMVEFLIQKAQNTPESKERMAALEEALNVSTTEKWQDRISQIELLRETLAPRFKKSPKKSEIMEVANDLKKARDFGKARMFYQHLVFDRTTPADVRRKAIQGLRSSFKLENDKSRFIQASEDLVRFQKREFLKNKKSAKSTKEYFDALLSLARAHWTVGQKKKTIAVLKEVEKTFSKRLPMTEIQWLHGRLEEEDGHFMAAVKWAEKGLHGVTDDDELRDKLLWQRAWNLYKLGNHRGSAETFAILARSSKSAFEKLKAQFWRAKSLQGLSLNTQSQEEFRQIVDQDPLGYYGLVASRELGLPISAKAATSEKWIAEKAPTTRRVAGTSATILLDWLVSVGEWKIAQDYLNELQKTDPQLFDGSADSALMMAKAGRFEALLQKVSSYPPETRKLLLNDNAEMVFPRPFREQIDDSASQFGISPEFIYAIMRQESSFNRRARSVADAYGLMQLLPETAQKAGAKTGIQIQHPEDLYDPQVNIPLGAAHLRNLSDSFQGQFILTVAGYNASREAVLSWVKSRYRNDALEFIEDIPYEETRSYVKLVLRNLVFYSALNHDKPIPFPEWCLKGLQNFKS